MANFRYELTVTTVDPHGKVLSNFTSYIRDREALKNRIVNDIVFKTSSLFDIDENFLGIDGEKLDDIIKNGYRLTLEKGITHKYTVKILEENSVYILFKKYEDGLSKAKGVFRSEDALSAYLAEYNISDSINSLINNSYFPKNVHYYVERHRVR